jgi:hypothetical protein
MYVHAYTHTYRGTSPAGQSTHPNIRVLYMDTHTYTHTYCDNSPAGQRSGADASEQSPAAKRNLMMPKDTKRE